MDHYRVVALSLIFLWNCSFAFLPQFTEGESSRSHKNITVEGITRAAARFIKMYNLVEDRNQSDTEAFNDFFGQDTDSIEDFLQATGEIVSSVNYIQLTYPNVSFYHVNGEDIEIAQMYLMMLRKMIISEAAKEMPSITFLREQIAYSLYTIQAFYSNTNWVEMRGTEVNIEFGTGNQSSLPIAKPLDPTCKDCDPTGFDDPSCDDNILVNDLLTSGYRSGQDKKKVEIRTTELTVVEGEIIERTVLSPFGKCSHGGLDDLSRTVRATGGINKERLNPLYSPHYKLHTMSATAAEAATVAFLIDEDTGIHQILQQELYQKVFNIVSKTKQSKMSLSFVIDVSGSMSDDINSVIQQTSNLVTSSEGSGNEPENYVLVTFNDPEKLTNGRSTTDGFKMISWLRALVTSGGEDCPEYTMSGILKGIELSVPGSTLYVFTDASAKDPEKIDEVIKAAVAKNITCEFLLTGTCTSRKRRETNRQKRSADVSFTQVADSTGGTVILTTKAKLSTIIESVVEGNLPSSTVNIESFRFLSSSMERVLLPVDNSINLYKVDVTGTSSSDDADLVYENGTSVITGNGVTVTKLALTGRTIFSVVNPPPGFLRLVKVNNGNWEVVVTAQSNMDVSVEILQRQLDDYAYPLFGNPIAGREYILTATMRNMNANSSIDSINIIDQSGNIEKIGNVTIIPDQSIFVIKYIFKKVVSAFQIEGKDEDSNEFKRTVFQTVLPVNGTLFLQTISQMSVDVPTTIGYEVKNTGGTQETFVLSIKDDQNFIPTSMQERRITLKAGESTTGEVEILPTLGPNILTYNASLRIEFSGAIVQSQTRVAQITTIKRPICTVNNITGTCPPESQTANTCADYEWMGLTTITFGGVMLSSVFLTNALNTTVLEVDDLTTSMSRVTANISGDCCGSFVKVIAVDTDGFFTACTIQLAENPVIIFIIPPTTTTETTIVVQQPQRLGQIVIYGIIAGAVLLVFILVIILTVVVIKKRKVRKEDVVPLT